MKHKKLNNMNIVTELISSGKDTQEIIKQLKRKSIDVPKWAVLEKDYEPSKHAIIADSTLRPKDRIKNGFIEKVAKLTYAAEKIVTRRMNQMAFTIPVERKYDYDPKNTTLKSIADAIEEVYNSVRINGVNINRMRAYFAACEVCTIWYPVETDTVHDEYGYPTKFKFRCRSYSPMDAKKSKISQADLYPLFDEYDNMIAMSIEYTRKEKEKVVKYFETYTSDSVYKWREEDGMVGEVEQSVVTIGKIQCIYLYRPEPIYEGIANNRNEIEFTTSRESDIIRKNSAPIMKIIGKFINPEDKPVTDVSREVFQMEQGGDVNTVSPTISPESTKFVISQMKLNIEEYTQMPNLSMENTKGLGIASGEARKTLLTDAHMKVGEEKHEIIWFLERECSIVKSLIAESHLEWESLIKQIKVRHIITPFVLNDKKAKAEELSLSVSNGFKSKLTAIREQGDVKDPEAELKQIELEQSQTPQDVFNTGE